MSDEPMWVEFLLAGGHTVQGTIGDEQLDSLIMNIRQHSGGIVLVEEGNSMKVPPVDTALAIAIDSISAVRFVTKNEEE